MVTDKLSLPTALRQNCLEHPICEEQDKNSLNRFRIICAQFKSVSPAFFILASGGMNIAWSIEMSWYPTYKDAITYHMRICWFLGAMIGALAGSALTHRVPMRAIFLVAATLVLVGGILLVSMPYTSAAVITARYFDGFANGLIFAPTLSNVGEVTRNSMRGMVAATIEPLSIKTGIFLKTLYTVVWRLNWNENLEIAQFQGAISIIFSIIAILIAGLLLIESPIYYLLRNSETDAVEALRLLQPPHMITSDTFAQLDEHKGYVAINRDLTFGRSSVQGLTALWRMCAYRLLNGLSFLMVSTLFVLTISSPGPHTIAVWPFALYTGVRWLGSVMAIFMMDTTGRKKPTLFCYLGCGAVAIALAVILDIENYQNPSHKITALIMLFIYAFVSSLANTASAVFLSEAFPLKVKPFYIAVTVFVELLVLTLSCHKKPNLFGAVIYFYVMGSVTIVFFFMGIFCLPETKRTTLNEAQEKFRKLFNQDF